VPRQYVFVDFENVHQPDISQLPKTDTTVILLLGAKQKDLAPEQLAKFTDHAGEVSVIRLAQSGRNALDFCLAFYLGRRVAADPSAQFHILSKDKDYDPMIEHLRGRHVNVSRADGTPVVALNAGAPLAKVVKAMKPGVPTEKLAASKPKSVKPPKALSEEEQKLKDRAIALLRKSKNRPKKRKKLESELKSKLGKDVSNATVTRVIEWLLHETVVVIDDKNAVTYQL
jgi:hypothetical protein